MTPSQEEDTNRGRVRYVTIGSGHREEGGMIPHSEQDGKMRVGRPANDNSEMVPFWVCLRSLADPAQRARAERRPKVVPE